MGRLPDRRHGAEALLRAGQAAAELKQWEKSRQLLVEAAARFPASPLLPEMLFGQAMAQQNLGQSDEAVRLCGQVISRTEGESAARARLMIARIQYARKDYAEAAKSFIQVAYGYEYPKWQAQATYEAGRCYQRLGQPRRAAKLYEDVVKKYPDSDQAPAARQQLKDLQPK